MGPASRGICKRSREFQEKAETQNHEIQLYTRHDWDIDYLIRGGTALHRDAVLIEHRRVRSRAEHMSAPA